MRLDGLRLAVLAAFALACGPALADPAPAGDTETIILIRHGEKPDSGLGQLSCQGFNRALALPAVLQAKFGKPTALFAPDPARMKEDAGKNYAYVRPLATIEPTGIRFGLPVDTSYGFTEVEKLQAALQRPALRSATVVVAWEHHLIDVLARALLAANGGAADAVPKWHGSDFDGIYVISIAWRATGSVARFARDREGLDDRSPDCPG